LELVEAVVVAPEERLVIPPLLMAQPILVVEVAEVELLALLMANMVAQVVLE